jgi:hypothetical protein
MRQLMRSKMIKPDRSGYAQDAAAPMPGADEAYHAQPAVEHRSQNQKIASREGYTMNVMFPVLVIAIGIVVLVLGKKLAVMGAAVGALLGVGLLRLLNVPVTDVLLTLLIPGLLALIGFFVAGFAKAIVNIILLVLGALAGAAIVLAFLDLFYINTGLLDWLLAVVGGVVGLIMVRRYNAWALIILSGAIGGLLVTRGLSEWLPFLKESLIGTLLVVVLAGGSIVFQGGFLSKGKAAPPAAK